MSLLGISYIPWVSKQLNVHYDYEVWISTWFNAFGYVASQKVVLWYSTDVSFQSPRK